MILQSIFGILVFTFLSWAVSENRKMVRSRIIIIGIMTQVIIAIFLFHVPFFQDIFISLNRLFTSLEEATRAGTSMVFGYIGGGALPFTVTKPGSTFILAFQALPLVLVISALSALLFYWKILPAVVRVFSWMLRKTFGIGGAEGVGISSNIFVGMVESPLLIRPYLTTMSRSELFTIMTCGMATIAGTVMGLYAGILGSVIPDIMGHLLTASIISAPAAITISKIIIPETKSATEGDLTPPEPAASSMDAITRGTVQGVKLLINIVAMIVVLVALVHLLDLLLGLAPDVYGTTVTLKRILGWVMAPVVWLMGIPWQEAPAAGSLMGTKTVLNELLAYIELSGLPEGTLSPKSMLIITYAMCGFANPGSLGIMIGGMGTMVPERRDEVVSLGLRAIFAGTLATCMTGAVVGIVG